MDLVGNVSRVETDVYVVPEGSHEIARQDGSIAGERLVRKTVIPFSKRYQSVCSNLAIME